MLGLRGRVLGQDKVSTVYAGAEGGLGQDKVSTIYAGAEGESLVSG